MTGHSHSLVIRPVAPADVIQVGELHCRLIDEGFLATLGPRFLARLYRRLGRTSHGFVLVAEVEGSVVGFVAVAVSTRAFYREFLVRDGAVAALLAMVPMLRSPRRVFETLRYGVRPSATGLPDSEVLAVAVAAERQGEGSGGMLLLAATAELRRRNIASARVVTAADNAAARRAYERAGFRAHSRAVVHRGTEQDVLVWP